MADPCTTRWWRRRTLRVEHDWNPRTIWVTYRTTDGRTLGEARCRHHPRKRGWMERPSDDD